jgi:hypothetical protein
VCRRERDTPGATLWSCGPMAFELVREGSRQAPRWKGSSSVPCVASGKRQAKRNYFAGRASFEGREATISNCSCEAAN